MDAGRDNTFRIRTDARPLYVRAEQALRDLIRRRGLHDGDRLPSEVELVTILGVSRSTIREALRNLQLQGQVRRVHGLGTLVTVPDGSIVAGLETLESLESLAQRQGWVCGTVDVAWDTHPLDAEEARLLRRVPSSSATLLTRVKTKDGRRVACMDSIVPSDVADRPEIETVFSVSVSIIETFKARGRPLLDRALADVQVELADMKQAGRLQVPVGSALLLLEEVFLDPEGRPFCLNRNWFVPGSMRLEFVRKLP